MLTFTCIRHRYVLKSWKTPTVWSQRELFVNQKAWCPHTEVFQLHSSGSWFCFLVHTQTIWLLLLYVQIFLNHFEHLSFDKEGLTYSIYIYEGFHKWRIPKMVGVYNRKYLKMDDLGILHFRKPPYKKCVYIYIYKNIQYIYIHTHTHPNHCWWTPLVSHTSTHISHPRFRADLPQQLSGGSPLAGQHCWPGGGISERRLVPQLHFRGWRLWGNAGNGWRAARCCNRFCRRMRLKLTILWGISWGFIMGMQLGLIHIL